MLLTRREAMAGCCGGLALLTELPALAEAAYPSQPIKMIVPYPAGGATDFLGRLVADPLTRDKLTGIALEPLSGSTPDEFAAFVRAEVVRWAEIVRNSGAELE